MWKWFTNLFKSSTPARDVLFCKKDGKKLVTTTDVLEYSAFTGEPSAFRTVKTCPACNCEVVSDVTVSL